MSNKIANIGAEKTFLAERINANVAHRLVVDTWRTFDAVSPRQCPTKNYRLAITTLRTPDARSAQSNIVIVRFQSYAPTLRCRRVATTRFQPFGKGKKLFPTHPSWSRDFIRRDSIRIGLIKIKCVCSKSKVKDVKYISLFETLSLQREFFNVIARRD